MYRYGCVLTGYTCHVDVIGEEGTRADETRGEGSSAPRLRVSEAREAAVDGPTTGQLAEERRESRPKVAQPMFRC